MTPQELVTSTSPAINAAGAAFYFDAHTVAAGKEIGLDGFRFYVLGRGGVLGDVESAVVTSAFGYFHPAVIDRIWSTAREVIDPRAGATAYARCAEEFGRAHLSEVPHLEAFNEAAEAVISAVDVSGLALFAGIAAEPLPDDAAARAMRNLATLREWRGSVHLVAVVAQGLRPCVAHAIRRPDDVATFGWDPAPEITETDRALLQQADERTDRLMCDPFAVLDDESATLFVETVGALASAVGR